MANRIRSNRRRTHVVCQAGATSIAISLLNVPLYLKDRAVNVTAFNDGFAQARLWPT